MRNFILILIFIITTLPAAYSQKIRIGITGGPIFTSNTRTNMYVARTDSSKDHSLAVSGVFSYFGGFAASIPLSKNIIFRPQIQYILKGWRNHEAYTYTNIDYNNRIKAHCIDLPLNFVYNIPTKNGRFFIGAGPYFSYVLSGTVYLEKDNTDYPLTFDAADTTNGFPTHRFDIGGNVIAGYEFRSGFFCTLNYAHGFKDFRIFMDESNPTNKITTVGLGIGYMFK